MFFMGTCMSPLRVPELNSRHRGQQVPIEEETPGARLWHPNLNMVSFDPIVGD